MAIVWSEADYIKDELPIKQDNALAISDDTAEMIKAGESANTLRA